MVEKKSYYDNYSNSNTHWHLQKVLTPLFPQVSDPLLLVEYPPTQHAHGLLSTALGLRVPIGRTMQVRCTARVAPAWREGSEAVVGNSQLADSKEAMLLGNLFYIIVISIRAISY